jgi:hypothetical protein
MWLVKPKTTAFRTIMPRMNLCNLILKAIPPKVLSPQTLWPRQSFFIKTHYQNKKLNTKQRFKFKKYSTTPQ